MKQLGGMIKGMCKNALAKVRTVGHRLVLVITYTVNFVRLFAHLHVQGFLNLSRSSFQYCYWDIRALYSDGGKLSCVENTAHAGGRGEWR